MELTLHTVAFSQFQKKTGYGPTDRLTDGRTDQWTDRPTDGRTERSEDRPPYKDARTHLKTMNRPKNHYFIRGITFKSNSLKAVYILLDNRLKHTFKKALSGSLRHYTHLIRSFIHSSKLLGN